MAEQEGRAGVLGACGAGHWVRGETVSFPTPLLRKGIRQTKTQNDRRNKPETAMPMRRELAPAGGMQCPPGPGALHLRKRPPL